MLKDEYIVYQCRLCVNIICIC